MAVRCSACDAENLDDGRFCIECGSPLRAAALGSTERLPEAESGVRCGACGTTNPAHAAFCVNCGRALEASQRAVAERMPQSSVMPLPSVASPLAVPSPHATRGKRSFDKAMLSGIGGGLFLIGLAFLFATDSFWPGILVLVGISGAIGSAAAGQLRASILPLIFMCGLAFLFTSSFFFPGILVLIGFTAILGALLGVWKD